MNQGPRWILLMKKTRAVKSCATVPLKIPQIFWDSNKEGFSVYLPKCLQNGHMERTEND